MMIIIIIHFGAKRSHSSPSLCSHSEAESAYIKERQKGESGGRERGEHSVKNSESVAGHD